MEIEIRKANEKDIEFLFELRNQPSTYQYAKHPKPVEWQEHIDWLEKIFSGQIGKELFVIELAGERVGQVRFDIDPENKQAIVNISLLKEFQAKGIAFVAIQTGIEKMIDTKQIKNFIAEIHQDNIASQKLFEKLGFAFQNQDDVWKTYVKTT